MKFFTQNLAALCVAFCLTTNVDAMQQLNCQQQPIPQCFSDSSANQFLSVNIADPSHFGPQCIPQCVSQNVPPLPCQSIVEAPTSGWCFSPSVLQPSSTPQLSGCQAWGQAPIVGGAIVMNGSTLMGESYSIPPIQAYPAPCLSPSPCPCDSQWVGSSQVVINGARKAGCSSAKRNLTREQAEALQKTFAMLKNSTPQQRMSACRQYCNTFFPNGPCNEECKNKCPFQWVDECDCECWDTPLGEVCDCELTFLPPQGSGGPGGQ
jgi:hypothetical protein